MISNHLHFVFGLSPDFGGKPFSLIHALAIESAIAVNKPDKVTLHNLHHPCFDAAGNHQGNIWWHAIKDKVDLKQIDYDTTSIFGIPLHHYAHRSDVVRLRTLLRHGGIYLDLDTICKKPLLYSSDNGGHCILGKEGKEGFCNGVMLAERNSEFLRCWLQCYAYFDNADWNYHSVKLPALLADERDSVYVGELAIQNEKCYHDPICTSSDQLFEQALSFPDAYCHHLWETHNWDKYLKHTTPEIIRTHDTTYNLIARQHLAGLGL